MEGWVDLGYIPRWFTRPQTVTLSNTNHPQCRSQRANHYTASPRGDLCVMLIARNNFSLTSKYHPTQDASGAIWGGSGQWLDPLAMNEREREHSLWPALNFGTSYYTNRQCQHIGLLQNITCMCDDRFIRTAFDTSVQTSVWTSGRLRARRQLRGVRWTCGRLSLLWLAGNSSTLRWIRYIQHSV